MSYVELVECLRTGTKHKMTLKATTVVFSIQISSKFVKSSADAEGISSENVQFCSKSAFGMAIVRNKSTSH